MQLHKLGIYTFIYQKKTKTPKKCEFNGSKVSKTPPLHTYDPQSIQTTNATEKNRNHEMGTILGGAPILFLLNGYSRHPVTMLL